MVVQFGQKNGSGDKRKEVRWKSVWEILPRSWQEKERGREKGKEGERDGGREKQKPAKAMVTERKSIKQST